MENNHFVGLQETHSTQGGVDAATHLSRTLAFWSHGTSHQAGVGLVLRDDFLKQFNQCDTETDWEEVVPGRVAILHLRGPTGSLDIVIAYLHTGAARHERAQAIRMLSARLQPQESALTILMGDFNFVVDEKDRWNKQTAVWSGAPDLEEAREFQQVLLTPHGFNELLQPLATCDTALARSRLDRVYSNHHTSDQLDRSYACSALSWNTLSAHRPVAFSRTKPKHDDTKNPIIPAEAIRHPDWARRVALCFQEVLRGDTRAENPVRQLVAIKRAMHDVSHALSKEIQQNAAVENEDKLGWTMSFVRAAEAVNLKRMSR